MTVQELIEKLSEMDPTRSVRLLTSDGDEVSEVDSEIYRSPYDGDFDNYVVVIK